MNSTRIKNLLIILVLIVTLLFPIGGGQGFTVLFYTSILAFIFGILLTPIMKYNSLRRHLTIKKPKWSDNMEEKYPLTYVQFIALLLIAAGTGGLLGGLFIRQIINFAGVILFMAGLGVYMGMLIILKRK